MIGKKWNDTRLQNLQKTCRDCTNRRCGSQSLFSLFFVRAVRVKKNLVACKYLYPGSKPGACLMPPRPSLQRRGTEGRRANASTPDQVRGMPNAPTPLLTKEGEKGRRANLYPGSKPGACLMPPRPSDPSLCSGQAKEGDRRAACDACYEQYGNGHSTRRDCLERSDGTFLRSTTERMEKQILSFDRLRTGALLRMTKRESGRGTEGKDPGSSITNVEDDRREKQILSFDRLRTGALLRIVNVQSFVDRMKAQCPPRRTPSCHPRGF